MTSQLEEVLDALCAQSHQRRLPEVHGLVRIDIHDGPRAERRSLRFDGGIARPTDEEGEPDCVVSGDRVTVEAVMTGRANAMAALLRGALHVEGRILLLVALQRLFPSMDHAGPSGGVARGQS